MSKRNDRDELDTETSFADMNVEGFSWYDPTKKKNDGLQKRKVTRKEYWQMVRGAFAAFLPYFFFFLCAMGILIVLAYFWLS
jgi:hypothetical protein